MLIVLRFSVEKTERKRSSPWKDGFLFVGNHLALDFLNTRPIMDDGPVELLPDSNAVLRWFQAAGVMNSRQAATFRSTWGNSQAMQDAAHNLRAWRERLRPALVAWEAGRSLPKATLQELNRLMAEYPLRTRLTTSGRDLTTESWFEVQVSDAEPASLSRRVSAALDSLVLREGRPLVPEQIGPTSFVLRPAAG